ncbi:hypothetical protein CFC21_093140 [Triticum aestivum]|uniref:Knottins-like domain-containing protein n=4 Tax=Triticinae TaxID=1648030 RepID=A0A9R1LKA2_WHEAT|nr:hypothetical protein CFC21_093139 [Triticum aestivum]KAF7090382.1 hypothetical protein CFC21_093140 [Triticum aestivum]
MGFIKVTSLLCLLLLTPLLLVPGSEAKTCTSYSRTYMSLLCKKDSCVEACHKEGFTNGFCFVFPEPIMLICFCEKIVE